ncbi:GH12 family glycosyl hydrolase domain-containing protein [Actinacidiphila bryophytorum]|uniref:Cellulose binding domain-containing protein n=5 Tax=Actinacidiphila bryophytorum TaxID=1436133 RepID=A0A9W4GYD4_9ACTN|nr:cellulose binding domain-containing protein [Actinacidiphila bryophytorum]MBM9440937.1 cellulose binding domain-containing protein [Actinacidiphila bryophytorum]CAG7612674.1 Cellulose binding domain-containing protein [Actinacidiphila bryophytorum]
MSRLQRALRSTRKTVLSAVVALGVAVGGLVALTAAPAAHADTQICDQYGSTTIQGRYVVQNNRWGTTATQCINVTSSGFQITQADGTATNGGPKSYPSVFYGCHYTNCSPGTNLPAQLSSISSAPTSVSFNYVGNAVYDAAYDIWLDPTAKKDGVNKTEIMVWYHQTSPVQPVGSKVGSANVAGRTWDVWTGNNGSNDVISFVSPSAISSWNFDVKAFANETISRGLAQSNWYLTSVQAGFEPWQNGAGLAVTSFSSSVNLGGSSTDGGTTNGGTSTGTTSGGTTGGSGSSGCKVTVTPQSWSGGFTANVTVANTGSSAVNGWKLGFTLPSGQTITSAWNATVSPSSGSVTATNLSYNAQIPAGGSQSFGFQGTTSGAYAAPTGFTLNGTACS